MNIFKARIMQVHDFRLIRVKDIRGIVRKRNIFSGNKNNIKESKTSLNSLSDILKHTLVSLNLTVTGVYRVTQAVLLK